MANGNISHVTHIAATPERLWAVLTSADALKEYWGNIRSEWTVGARVEETSDSGQLLWQGEVRQCDVPRHLSFTFEVAGSGEKPTDVRFEITPPVSKVRSNNSVARLIVTQSGFPENSKLAADCARAWTEILSSMKSYVETGKALPFEWKH